MYDEQKNTVVQNKRSILKEFKVRPQREVRGEYFFVGIICKNLFKIVTPGSGPCHFPAAEDVEDAVSEAQDQAPVSRGGKSSKGKP